MFAVKKAKLRALGGRFERDFIVALASSKSRECMHGMVDAGSPAGSDILGEQNIDIRCLIVSP